MDITTRLPPSPTTMDSNVTACTNCTAMTQRHTDTPTSTIALARDTVAPETIRGCVTQSVRTPSTTNQLRTARA